MNMCLAGQVSSTLLGQDRLRADQVHGVRDLDDDNENIPINPRAPAPGPSARQRRRLARLPASNVYHQGTLVTFRNLFIFFIFGAIGVELFRWHTVFQDIQAELEQRYDDEYFIWRDVFVNGADPEKALSDNAERKENPDNQYEPSQQEEETEDGEPKPKKQKHYPKSVNITVKAEKKVGEGEEEQEAEKKEEAAESQEEG